MRKPVDLTLYVIFLPFKTFFLNKTYSYSDRYSNVLSRELIKPWKYSVVHELYAKIYVRIAIIRLRKKCYNLGKNEDISMKTLYDN